MTNGWVLATRTEEELEPLRAALELRGVRLLGYPVLCAEAPCDFTPQLEQALGQCSLIAFTSRRAPAALRRGAGKLWPAVLQLPAAAVGATTAGAASREGFRVEVVGDAGGEALAALVRGALPPDGVVLHACGRAHRDEFRRTLAGSGIRVLAVVVYRVGETPAADLPPLPPEPPRVVLLTSPRAARAYLHASSGRFAGVPHLALGPTTASAAIEAGLPARPLSASTPDAVLEEICLTCS